MLHLSIRRIEVFIAVVDGGSFSAAAARLGISQPSVSEHIRALEEGIGDTLLERKRGHAAKLTPAGAALLTRARSLLTQATELAAYAEAGRAQGAQRIVVASQRRISNAVLPKLLAGFARSHPEIELVVKSGSMEEVVAMLRSGAASVGYFLCNEPVPEIESQVITTEPFVFVAAPDHPLASRTRIAPHELAGCRFIRGASGSLLGREVDGLLASIGLTDIDVASRSTDDAIILQLVMSGVGIYFTMHKSVKQQIREGLVKRLPVTAPPLTLAVRQALSPKGRPNAMTRLFCRHVEAHWPG